MKKKLDFVTRSKVEMKQQYKRKVSKLRSNINFQKIHQLSQISKPICDAPENDAR